MKHVARYLDAYQSGIVDSADLGYILDEFVMGFDDEYQSSEHLHNVPSLIMYLTEDDSREDVEYALTELAKIVSPDTSNDTTTG